MWSSDLPVLMAATLASTPHPLLALKLQTSLCRHHYSMLRRLNSNTCIFIYPLNSHHYSMLWSSALLTTNFHFPRRRPAAAASAEPNLFEGELLQHLIQSFQTRPQAVCQNANKREPMSTVINIRSLCSSIMSGFGSHADREDICSCHCCECRPFLTPLDCFLVWVS